MQPIYISTAITIIVYLVTIGYFWGKMKEKTNHLDEKLKDLNEKINSLDSKCVKSEAFLLLANRVSEVEKILPKLYLMENNISWMKEWIQNLSNKENP